MFRHRIGVKHQWCRCRFYEVFTGWHAGADQARLVCSVDNISVLLHVGAGSGFISFASPVCHVSYYENWSNLYFTEVLGEAIWARLFISPSVGRPLQCIHACIELRTPHFRLFSPTYLPRLIIDSKWVLRRKPLSWEAREWLGDGANIGTIREVRQQSSTSFDIIELSHGMVRKHGGIWSTGGTSLPLAALWAPRASTGAGKHFGPPLTLQKLHQMIHQNLTRHAKPTPLGWVFKEACFFASAPTFYDRGP